MPVSKVEVVVLGLLVEEPLYGYELLERFRDSSLGFWVEVGRASVYQALHRLEREGLVSGKAQEGDEGPDRRVFRITKTGRDRLHTGLVERAGGAEPYESGSGLALGFAHLLTSAESRAAVVGRTRALTVRLDQIADERARTASQRGPARTAANRMLDQQEALAKAELAWLKTLKG